MSQKISCRREVLLAGAAGLFMVGCKSSQPITDRRNGFAIRVRKGETLYSISRYTGLSVQEIMRFNDLTSTELIEDQLLYLPDYFPSRPRTHASGYKEEPLPPYIPQKITGYKGSRTFDNRSLDRHHERYQMEMVSRRQWGADLLKSNHNPMKGVNKITVHHTSEYPGMDRHNDVEVVKKISDFHRERRQWADIGYHFLIGRDGRIYEGRSTEIQGAHVRNNNPHNLGISLIGNFNKHPPSKEQLRTLRSFLRLQQRKHQVPNSKVFGHRDFNATECPGKFLYAWLRDYRTS